MTADQIYDLSTELYRAEKSLEQEELDILHTIGLRVNPPTPTAFMREMLCMIPTDLIPQEEAIGKVRVQLDLMLREEVFVTEKPSMLVLAALHNAITAILNTEKVPKLFNVLLFSALGLSEDAVTVDALDGLSNLILTILVLRGSCPERDHQTEEPVEDDTKVTVRQIETEQIECSSPRSIVSNSVPYISP